MDAELFNIFYQFLVNLAFLLFAAMGLIVVLGMINIINLAHGEFIMLGAYTSTLAYHAGVPFLLTIPLAAVSVGLFGMVLERFAIRRFYGKALQHHTGGRLQLWATERHVEPRLRARDRGRGGRARVHPA